MPKTTGATQLSLWTFAKSQAEQAKDGDTTKNSPTPMSSLAASHAKTSQAQGNVLDWKAHVAVYGGSFFGSYARYDHAQSCWKMSPQSRTSAQMRKVAVWSNQMHSWLLVRCPTSGMTVNGKLYRLPMLAHHTSASGGSAWATPVASDNIQRQLPDNIHVTKSGTLKKDNQGHSNIRLNQAVVYYDNKTQWHTPICNDAIKTGNVAQIPANGLTAQIGYETQKWSTPTARDKSSEGYQAGMRRKSPKITTQVQHENNGKGKLNPDWVEMLMGFPAGWTDID